MVHIQSNILIVYISFNSLELIERSINSILPFIKNNNCQFIIWENGKYYENWKFVKKRENIIYKTNRTNCGYGSGINLAVKDYEYDYLFIINPDTIICHLEVNKIITFLNMNEIGFLGIAQINEMHEIVSSTRSFPNLLFQIYDLFLLNSIFKKSRIFGAQLMTNNNHKTLFFPEVIVGSFMAVKREKFEMVGGFDSNYFMYCEETDICFRMIKKGKKNIYLPDQYLLHTEGGSTPNLYFQIKNNYVSLNYYYSKHNNHIVKYLLILLNMISKFNRMLFSFIYGIITFNKNYIYKSFCYFKTVFSNPTKYYIP